MDLHKIANSGGYGSGRKVLDKAKANAERRAHIPLPEHMNEMMVGGDGALIAHFGNDPEDGKDYRITVDAYGSTIHCNPAGFDSRAFVALWNAYRDGDLVWSKNMSEPKEPE